MKSYRNSRALLPSASIASALSSPNRRVSVAKSCRMVPLVIPPLRVEAPHRNRDCGTGNDGEPWSARQILLGAIEHVAPARQWRLDAVAEEADIGFQKDRTGDRQACGDDDWTHGIGQDLAEHDMPPA